MDRSPSGCGHAALLTASARRGAAALVLLTTLTAGAACGRSREAPARDNAPAVPRPPAIEEDHALASLLAGGVPGCEIYLDGFFEESCAAATKLDQYVASLLGDDARRRAAAACANALVPPVAANRFLAVRCLEQLPAAVVAPYLPVGLDVIKGTVDAESTIAVARGFAKVDARSAGAAAAVRATILALNRRQPTASNAATAVALARTLGIGPNGTYTPLDPETTTWALEAIALARVDHLAGMELHALIGDRARACATIAQYLDSGHPWSETLADVVGPGTCDAHAAAIVSALVPRIGSTNENYLASALAELDARTTLPQELRAKVASALRERCARDADRAAASAAYQRFIGVFCDAATAFEADHP